MHRNYIVEFDDGFKVFYRGQNTVALPQQNKDIYFGDPLSLKREVAVMRRLHQTAIKAPEIYFFEEGKSGTYAILSFLEGVRFNDYLRQQGHQLPVFFNSLRDIGRTLASASTILFDKFGSVQADGIGDARINFADRLTDVLGRHATNPSVRSLFTDAEWTGIETYIAETLAEIRAHSSLRAQLVVYDLHARNFFVHAEGKHAGDLCGVFDVEFAQAAPASLEWHFMSLALFSLYGKKWFTKAKAAFLQGYGEGGGDVTDNQVLQQAYAINYALSVVGFYNGFHDGIRDGWSAAFKQWTLDIVRGSYDPGLQAELTRPLHKVPVID
ncbi:phosphotransferase [Candidatus Kaiserbacteria bacterium]|nr:phosphotransferase [Candidatus Kaiserbacteria bacterium]